jgi:hypothetical protein
MGNSLSKHRILSIKLTRILKLQNFGKIDVFVAHTELGYNLLKKFSKTAFSEKDVICDTFNAI